MIHLRHVAEFGPDEQAEILLANLPSITDDVEHGAIATLSPTRLAIREPPIR